MRFELNGRGVEAPEGMADDPLLWVLRDHFRLNGPKHGCGVGACGACVVHLDGEPMRACLLTPRDVAGHRVTTLEGLGAGFRDGLHPVQAAWIAQSVPQCGYCQNGQIMTAAALIDRGADAAETAAALDGVVCRCGTYGRIAAAVAQARRLAGRP